MSENNIMERFAILKREINSKVSDAQVGKIDKLGFKNNSGKNSGFKNLKPFPKGKSGNPNGRPVSSRNYDTIRKEALIKLGKESGKTPDEIEVDLVKEAILHAKKGDFRFYKDDKDRVHGQSVSRSEIGGLKNGNPIKLELEVQRILDKTYGE